MTEIGVSLNKPPSCLRTPRGRPVRSSTVSLAALGPRAPPADSPPRGSSGAPRRVRIRTVRRGPPGQRWVRAVVPGGVAQRFKAASPLDPVESALVEPMPRRGCRRRRQVTGRANGRDSGLPVRRLSATGRTKRGAPLVWWPGARTNGMPFGLAQQVPPCLGFTEPRFSRVVSRPAKELTPLNFDLHTFVRVRDDLQPQVAVRNAGWVSEGRGDCALDITASGQSAE